MSKLGQFLKAEREKKGLSLHEIGMTLKINSKILKAIEDGDQKNLPAKTFLRGFVKSYAQFLRLDVKTALDLFQEDFGLPKVEEPTQKQTLSSPEQPLASANAGQDLQTPKVRQKFESKLARPDNPALPAGSSNRLYTIIGGICLLLLIAFVAKMVDKYQKESHIQEAEVVEEVPAGELPKETSAGLATGESTPVTPAEASMPVASVVTVVSGSASTTTVTIISTTTLPKVTTTFATSTSLKPTTTSTSTTTSTTNAPTTTRPTVRATTSTTLAANAQPQVVSAPAAKTTEVIIEALNKVSLRFSLNNGKTESLDLGVDQTHTLRSKGTIQVEINDGGAVNIIVNGRVRGVPGPIGKSIKLSFP